MQLRNIFFSFLLLSSLVSFGKKNEELKKLRKVLFVNSPFQASSPHLDSLFKNFYISNQFDLLNEQDSLYSLLNSNKITLLTPNDSAIYYYNLGVYWVIKSDYEKAQLYQTKAGIIFDREQKVLPSLYIDQQMANLTYYLKQTQLAHDKFQTILNNPNSDKYLKAVMNHNIGALLMELDSDYFSENLTIRQKSVSKIEFYLDKAIALFQELGYSKGAAGTYSVYVNIKLYAKKLLEAQEMIDSCQSIAERIEDEGRIAFLQIKKSMLMTKLGNFDASIDTAFKAFYYYKSIGNFDQAGHSLGAVHAAMLGKKDYKNADSIAVWMMENYRDNLNKKLVDDLSKYRAEFETEKKNNELKEKTILLESERLKMSNRNRLLIALGFGIIAIIAFFLFVLQRNKRKTQLEKDTLIIKNREDGIKSILHTQEAERKRIAADLHDGIVQQLGGLKLGLQKIFSEKEIETSEKMLEILDDSTKELRDLSHRMMPRSLLELGLIAALEDMLEISLGNLDLKYEFEQFGLKDRLPENVEIVIYRIGQELIGNVIKHSKASLVNIQLFKAGENVIFIVEDNGKGMVKDNNSEGIGLLNISSRLNTINGNVNYEPSPSSGTLVTVKIPLDQKC